MDTPCTADCVWVTPDRILPTMSKSELHDIIERGHDLAASTKARYLRDVDDFIKFAGPDPMGWTPRTAEDFYTHLLTRMQPQSAKRHLAAVHYAAEWRAKQLNIPNFVIVRRAPNNPAEERSAMTEEQAQKLLRTCLGKPEPLAMRDLALFVVELETGMRRMSIQSMTWDNITTDQKLGFPVARVLAKGHEKTRQNVPLSDTALKALEPWRAWRDVTHGPVFVALGRYDGKPARTPISDTAIQKIVSARAKQAGIGHLHPHLFRHTFVTWRLNAGLSPHEISVMTGHKLSGLGAISGFQAGLGAMAGYIDMRAVGEKVRNSTPQWLKELFP